MKNEFDFYFSDKKDPEKSYFATYYLSTKKPPAQLRITGSIISKKISPKAVWEIFHDNATFSEILKNVEPTGIDESLISKMHEFKENGHIVYAKKEENKESFVFSFAERNLLNGDLAQKKRTSNEILALEIIRENPSSVLDMEYAYELMKVLKTARWSFDKKASDRAKKLLMDHLIPKHPGGQTPVPENLKAVKAIMIDLAEHISRKCKDHINSQTALSRGDKIEEDLYSNIKDWASKINEFRISRLSLTSLNTLVFSPVKYVNSILLKHFKCKDLRTLGLS